MNSIIHKHVVTICLFFCFCNIFSQVSPQPIAEYLFNKTNLREMRATHQVNAVGIYPTEDRFGNHDYALFFQGQKESFLSLGSSKKLKPTNGAISLWVKLNQYIYLGKGFNANPIIATRNAPVEDFSTAYGIAVEGYSRRLIATMAIDSINTAQILSKEKFVYQKWHHLVLNFNKNYFELYINGELQQRVNKKFTPKYDSNDSVVVGNTCRQKNLRFSQGSFDDILFFDNYLTKDEILALYNSPNPAKGHETIRYISLLIAVTLVFVVIIIAVIYSYKRVLKKQQEYHNLNSRIIELEILNVKNQMNPHFISNCLSAVQELIYLNKSKEAGLYLARFSFFLRQVMSLSENTFVSLSEELEVVKLYLELEQLRFKNTFEYSINYLSPINTDTIEIPCFTIQPFLENSIWHGLIPQAHYKTSIININIYQTDDTIFIEITDNGIGRQKTEKQEDDSGATKILKDKIENINKLFKTENYSFTTYDLKDESGNPEGTKVVIKLINENNL